MNVVIIQSPDGRQESKRTLPPIDRCHDLDKEKRDA